jgi:arylsulfatase A-like enzyme
LAIVLLVAAAVWMLQKHQSRPPEHLVLVVFDTLRADHMSVYGYPRSTTPFLQSVMNDFVRFAEVRAPAPWTIPSHASLFTGLPPSQHRAQWGRMRLGEEFETLAEILSREGFCTDGLSANPLVAESTGLAQGFASLELVRGPWPERSATILSKLPQLIDARLEEGCRLFLFVNFMDTHIPYNAGRYAKQFGVDSPGPVRNAKIKWQITAGVRSFSDQEKDLHERAYDAAVRHVDDLTRDLLAILEEKRILDKAVVVLTSDHGDGLGIHPEIGHSVSIWEEQLRVPLLVRFPHGRSGGASWSERISLVSLMPSMLDWLGVQRPPGLRSAADLRSASEAPVFADYRSYFSERNRKTNADVRDNYPDLAARVAHAHALYCDQYKLIRDANGNTLFFDVLSDPEEQTPLDPKNSRGFQECLRDYEAAVSSGLLTPFTSVHPEIPGEESAVDLEALRSLGYVQ